MTLKLTLFQRFNLENVLNQQEPKPQRDQFILWGISDKIAFDGAEKEAHTKIVPGFGGQDINKLDPASAANQATKDFEVTDSEKEYLSDVLRNRSVTNSDRLWIRDVMRQL